MSYEIGAQKLERTTATHKIPDGLAAIMQQCPSQHISPNNTPNPHMVHRVFKPRPRERERTDREEIAPQRSSRQKCPSHHRIHMGKRPSRTIRSDTDHNRPQSRPKAIRSTEIRTEDPISYRSVRVRPICHQRLVCWWAVQVGRGIGQCGSNLGGVIMFLCLMGRSYSGVGGMLAGIFALVLSSFCGPISYNMSIWDAHPRIGISPHLDQKVSCFEISHLFMKRSVVSGCRYGF
jgi:hypothetical protein